jgi:hypothetical protein
MAASEITDLTLVDYFAVVGLDKSTGLRLDPSLEALGELSGTSGVNEKLPPLERTYETKILAHFPEKRRGYPFLYEAASVSLNSSSLYKNAKNFFSYVCQKDLNFIQKRMYQCFHIFIHLL